MSNSSNVSQNDILLQIARALSDINKRSLVESMQRKESNQDSATVAAQRVHGMAKTNLPNTIKEISKVSYESDDFASHFKDNSYTQKDQSKSTEHEKDYDKFGKLLEKFANKFGKSVDDLGQSTDRLKDVTFADNEARPQKKFGGLLGKFIDKGVNAFGGMSPSEMRREEWAKVSENVNLKEQQDAILARATGSEDGRNNILDHEQRQLDALKKELELGNVDTNGVAHDAFLEKAKQDLIDRNNLGALVTRKPEFDLDYQEELKGRLGITKTEKSDAEEKQLAATKLELEKLLVRVGVVEANAKLNAYQNGDLDPAQAKQEDDNKDILDQVIDHINKNSEYLKTQREKEVIPVAEKPWESHGKGNKFVGGDKLKLKELKVGVIKSNIINTKKISENKDSLLGPIVTGLTTAAASDKAGSIGGNGGNLDLNNVTIKSLTILGLVMPHQENAGQPAESGGSSVFGDVDIDVSKSRTAGKAAGLLGKVGRFASKAALPLAAGMAIADGVSGYTNANENLGIDGREATFGEKMSSAAGSVASGLTFGLVDAKSASKGIASVFGAGPDIPLTKSDKLNAIPDQKQAELSAARADNEELLQSEKDAAASAQGNVVINSPTTIAASGKSPAPASTGAVRPNHNAYERFVDRVFTAV